MKDSIELSLFASRIEAICDEMGAVLRRSSFSPNIKDRLDFSCAVFDAGGQLCAQAAHIPVHLGSMAFAMKDLVKGVEWHTGDMLIVNDPFMGGTHLPDVTLIAPVFSNTNLLGFVANRAHHADIGAETPGSMPISHRLDEEGIIIPPSMLIRAGELDEKFLASITENTRQPGSSRGDFMAQISANSIGVRRLNELITSRQVIRFTQALKELNDYAERLARSALKTIPDGVYTFQDLMDDDGMGNCNIPLVVKITIDGHNIHVDFSGSAMQVKGNINCPFSVAAAAVYYVFRCLMPAYTPACAGAFRSITMHAPEGCLLNAKRPAAVAAGNVETSTRIVDLILGALAQAVPELIPAASHGSMNNLALGSHDEKHPWDYYETMGGGMGAGPHGGGLHAVQTHMTNTLNTPIEALEMSYPIRVSRYAIRRNSGGKGRINGGNGLVREIEVLRPAIATLLTERRSNRPWGLAGGEAASPGVNLYNDKPVPGKVTLSLNIGDKLTIKTPGGGGWGQD